ncbi:MAG: DUF3987 domain-containing protein [Phycisphaerales bacterium]|nr:DUF3987 domain-containing protein [Phycisphaerales bacterium]
MLTSRRQETAQDIKKHPQGADKPHQNGQIRGVCQRRQPIAFPTHVLPEPLKDLVVATTDAIGCDPVFTALPGLIALAGCIGTTRKLMIKRGHEVPAVLWGCVIAPSGSAKSPAAEPVFAPLSEIQRVKIREYDVDIRQYEQDMANYKTAMQKHERSTSKGAAPKTPSPPKPTRYLVRDVTMEGMCSLLSDNPRGLIYATDELAGWIGMFDRYTTGGRGGGDRAHWISIYDAGEVIVDRKGHRVKEPCLQHLRQ